MALLHESIRANREAAGSPSGVSTRFSEWPSLEEQRSNFRRVIHPLPGTIVADADNSVGSPVGEPGFTRRRASGDLSRRGPADRGVFVGPGRAVLRVAPI